MQSSLSSLNMQEIFEPIEASLDEPDSMLGKGLMMPFNNTNSGGRKLLYSTQREHVIPINDAEVAYIQTGEEQQFGWYSSSLKYSKGDYQLIAKIPKFSNMPSHHYFAIFVDCTNNMVEVEERKCYKHLTESYGYMLNNDTLDRLNSGDKIKENSVLQKSVCYDEFNNRKDGLNLFTGYISCARTMEDGILISRSAQKKMVTPLVHFVSIVANDNDIPLNMFGYDDKYKIIPDVGEEVPEGILMGLRRENKEEILFTQTYSRLKDILMSDDKFTVEGKVVDINVHCNNPDNVANNPYYSQIKYYYDENLRFCRNVVETVESLNKVYKLSYDLQKLYYNCKQQLDGIQFIKDRPFSNIIIDIVLVEQNMIQVGDKLSDRYGGKGVVVGIVEDELMPRLTNGQVIEIIFNKSTCINRLNAGQLFETEINHIAQNILELISTGALSTDESIDMYLRFIRKCNLDHAKYMEEFISGLDDCSKEMYVDDLVSHNGIYQALKPITDSFTLDKLSDLYNEFPWIKQYTVEVPMKNSRGEIVYRNARRPIVCGTKYILRLKQYAREKFSVCSLSSTNIRGENSRSKANKLYKGQYTKTPIRFGEMESGNMGHMYMELVIIQLLLHSASPYARRMAGEQLLTGDPFNIDVKLDTNCVNAGVQSLNTLFKTIGLRLVFRKTAVNLIKPIKKNPMIRLSELPPSPLIKPMWKIDKRAYFAPDLGERMHNTDYTEDGLIIPMRRSPIIKGIGVRDKYAWEFTPPEEIYDVDDGQPVSTVDD